MSPEDTIRAAAARLAAVGDSAPSGRPRPR